MTKETYWSLVQHYDLVRAREEEQQIPHNINRAGKLYRKLLQKIEAKYNVKL